MCTAISYLSGHHYFGRNLDLEYHYQESVTITPRYFPLHFRNTPSLEAHNAIIGIATVMDGYPLYYDAVNEHGLSIAALNFPGNAVYNKPINGKTNISAFELIPYLLANFCTTDNVNNAIKDVNITDIAFCDTLPPTPLHWIVADRNKCITIEQTSDGLQVYDNPVKVLTNNPPFSYHLQNLNNYLNLTAEEPVNRFGKKLDLTPSSRGMGGIGLPGDLSSMSRFVRAAFVLQNSSKENGDNAISQFFHILTSVEQQKGCVKIGDQFERTIYSSCCDTDRGIYYYTTYSGRQIAAVDMHKTDLNSASLASYPLNFDQIIHWQTQ